MSEKKRYFDISAARADPDFWAAVERPTLLFRVLLAVGYGGTQLTEWAFGLIAKMTIERLNRRAKR